MVNAPPNYPSLKDYNLQQINNGYNCRLSINCTESIKQEGGGGGKGRGAGGKKGRGAGGGSTLTYLSDEVRHLFLTAASNSA